MRRHRHCRWAIAAFAVTLVLGGCAGASSPAGVQQGGQAAPEQPRRTKTIVFAVTGTVEGVGMLSGTTTTGGWATANEIHSNGLITSEPNAQKPIGRLAERVPTVDDGGVSLLPDGRMRVVYNLRRDASWQDGTPFTAHDLVFSQRIYTERTLPYPTLDAVSLMDTSEASDDSTFVLYFKKPYYLGASLGVRLFWPLPRHILEAPYQEYVQSRNAEDFMTLPYWSAQFVGLGPFRITSWDPGTEVLLQAYDAYFLGRPKADFVRIRFFSDQQTLLSNLLAGAVDLYPETTVNAELSEQLRQRWEPSGAGTVYIKEIAIRFIGPQWRASLQMEPANLDPRVRAALYHALDRETLAEAMMVGHREMAAYAILPPQDPNFEAARDALRPYSYDPDRARTLLRDLGWMAGPDGVLRHSSDGRRFRNAMIATIDTAREIPPFADYWRRIGLEVEEQTVPASQTRNLEFRASFPGWAFSAKSPGDGILGQLEGPAASPQTRWVGNRDGYDDPRAQALIERYRASLSPRDQFAAMKEISDLVATELLFLPAYRTADSVGVRSGIKAYDDHMGGTIGGNPFGGYARNSHLWDIL